MSPEQARGKAVDNRTDIWAFGCLLFEISRAAGRCEVADVVETLSSIARDSPDWSRLQIDVPPTVRTLLERCLDKNPHERLRDIAEARVALTRTPMTVTMEPAAGRTRSTWVNRLAWAAAGLIAGAFALLAWMPRGTDALPIVTSLRQLMEAPGEETGPDISPDGRHVLYAAGPAGKRDLYLLRVGGGRAISLTRRSPADDWQGAFSHHGERIAFRSDRDVGGLFVMGATGESVKRVTSAGFDPRWSPGRHAPGLFDGSGNRPVLARRSRLVRAWDPRHVGQHDGRHHAGECRQGGARLIRKMAGVLSGSGRALLLERARLEADLWVMKFKK